MSLVINMKTLWFTEPLYEVKPCALGKQRPRSDNSVTEVIFYFQVKSFSKKADVFFLE